MNTQLKFKCLNCSEIHFTDPRKRGRQRYCKKPNCKKASKASSQRQWTAKQENQNYFRGTENCERVRQWRKEHPGYSRNKKTLPEDALQDLVKTQDLVVEVVAPESPPGALQDVCFTQPALFVGLISIMTGHALQEEIAATVRSFLTRGEDIQRITPRDPQFPIYVNQTPSLSRTFAACAASI